MNILQILESFTMDLSISLLVIYAKTTVSTKPVSTSMLVINEVNHSCLLENV